MNAPVSRIPSLDGLRAISIAMVVLSHFFVSQSLIAHHGRVGAWLDTLGSLGVRVFFVISGFLISGLLFREIDTTHSIYLPRFYLRRTMRILVPYYIFLCTVVILRNTAWVTLAPYDLIHAFSYTTNYYPDRSWFVGHSWSLSVEEQFYLLWPCILYFSGKRRGLWIALAVVALCPVLRLGYFYLQPSFAKYEILYRFETAADSIAVGCLLAGSFQWLLNQPGFQKVLQSRLLMLVPFVVLAIGTSITLQIQYRPLYLLLGITIQNVGIALCIAWSVTYHSGRIGRILNSRPLVFIGLISYSLYLWHPLFLFPDSSPTISSLILNLTLVALVSLASFYLVERPSLQIRQWLETKIFGMRTVPASADSVVGHEIEPSGGSGHSLDSSNTASL